MVFEFDAGHEPRVSYRRSVGIDPNRVEQAGAHNSETAVFLQFESGRRAINTVTYRPATISKATTPWRL
jgi:hypothetical protein